MHRHAGGLANLGGTCYLNSVLQVLRSSDALRLPSGHGQTEAEPALVAHVRSVLAELDAAEGRTVSPGALLQRLQGLAGPRFCIQQPNDLHEIYVRLIEWLTAAAQSTDRPPAPPSSEALDPEAQAAWSACLQGSSGALLPSLYGMLRRDVRCGRCGATYTNHETFSALVLDVPPGDGPTPLSTVILAHFAERDLNADGGTWKCDRCSATGAPAWTSARMVHAPRVLTFALNRYGGEGRDRGVSFPPALDLVGKGRYRCTGAALHVGGMTGGHCFAAAPRRGDGRWAMYDDACVSELMGPPNGPQSCRDVQLLTYVLNDAHLEKKE